MMNLRLKPLCIAAAAIALFGCGKSGRVDSGMASAVPKPLGKPIKITPPLGLPPVPIPANNPVTAETVALGRHLFYEKRLSKDNSLSCAS